MQRREWEAALAMASEPEPMAEGASSALASAAADRGGSGAVDADAEEKDEAPAHEEEAEEADQDEEDEDEDDDDDDDEDGGPGAGNGATSAVLSTPGRATEGQGAEGATGGGRSGRRSTPAEPPSTPDGTGVPRVTPGAPIRGGDLAAAAASGSRAAQPKVKLARLGADGFSCIVFNEGGGGGVEEQSHPHDLVSISGTVSCVLWKRRVHFPIWPSDCVLTVFSWRLE